METAKKVIIRTVRTRPILPTSVLTISSAMIENSSKKTRDFWKFD
jgi:hypothetical protein